MAAVFKRELSAYFNTFIGYFFVAVFFAACAFGFVFGCISSGVASMFTVANLLSNTLCLLVPVLTMRIFSEERKQKTDQLLFTAPVTVGQIVLGKYFAAFCVIGVSTLLSLVFPVIMMIYGNPYIGEIVLSYVGLLLLCSALLAIGTLVSTLTEHQFIASLITFFIILMLMALGSILPDISSPTLYAVASWFAMFERFADFAGGILRFDSIIYYLSFTAVLLLLTGVSLQRRQAGA